MMPHLGVLAQVHPKAALEVFERDCLIYLGTCIAPRGNGKPGKPCFCYEIKGPALNESGELAFRELKRLPLGAGETARIKVEPARGFDMGAGPGKPVEREIKGGTVGIILDARGRPLGLPEDEKVRREMVTKWIEALDLYPGRNLNHGDTETRR
jgi:hypothetical protein